MANEFQPNPAQAVQWLRWLDQDGPLYIETMASVEQEKPVARQFAPGQEAQAIEFIAEANCDASRRNIYFVLNARFLNGPRKKANLSFVQALHVDLDFKDYPGTEAEKRDRPLALLTDPKVRPKSIPEPSMVWCTGGGYQAVWKLAEPITVEEAEQLNRALLNALQGGPGTHNADRLLRVVCTMNWLNENKRAAGRNPSAAWPVEPVRPNSPPRTYLAADFGLKVPKSKVMSERPTSSAVYESEELEPLPLPQNLMEVVPSEPKWVEVIVTGRNPPDRDYASRSELVLATTIWLLSHGVQPGHVLSIITAADLGSGLVLVS
jgi:hypothetical protein